MIQPLALKVHGKSLGEHAHGDLGHGIGRLPPEEPAVDRGADDNNPAALPAPLEVRERSLDGAIEALRVDALHQLVPLRGRVVNGGPPDGAGVVDQHVEASVFLDCLRH